MWTLIGVYNTFFSSGDVGWLKNIWGNYTLALNFIVNKTVPLSSGSNLGGLLNVTGLRDWARFNQGGLNAEANAIYYKLLTVSAELAGYLNDSSLQASYTSRAAGLKTTFNAVYWDDTVGMFKDNDTVKGAGVHPQDANSMAVLFGLVDDVGVDGGKVEMIGSGL
jgi:glycogen debranching enzyme